MITYGRWSGSKIKVQSLALIMEVVGVITRMFSG